MSPGRQKPAPRNSGAAPGKYPAATHSLPRRKIRSKKQLVAPYLHGMNSPALQQVPRQARRPSRKSSKQWEKHSTPFLDNRQAASPRPAAAPKPGTLREEAVESGREAGRGSNTPGRVSRPQPQSHQSTQGGGGHPLQSPESLRHLPVAPTKLPRKVFFPSAFSQYWAFF